MRLRASFPFLRLPAMLLSTHGKSLNVILRIDLGFNSKKILIKIL